MLNDEFQLISPTPDKTDSAYQIRLARPADISAIGEIERAADRLFPKGRIPDNGETIEPVYLEKALAADLLFVAQHAHSIVGFAVCSVHHRILHLHQVSVHPEYSRRGIGRTLLQTILTESKTRHLHGVTLTTFCDIPWNAPFYERLGFRILANDELCPELRTTLEQEQRLGMVNRVAMVYDNRSGNRAIGMGH